MNKTVNPLPVCALCHRLMSEVEARYATQLADAGGVVLCPTCAVCASENGKSEESSRKQSEGKD